MLPHAAQVFDVEGHQIASHTVTIVHLERTVTKLVSRAQGIVLTPGQIVELPRLVLVEQGIRPGILRSIAHRRVLEHPHVDEGLHLVAENQLILSSSQFAAIIEYTDEVAHQFQREVLPFANLGADLTEHLDGDLQVIWGEVIRLGPSEGAKSLSLVDDSVHHGQREEHSLEFALVSGDALQLIRRYHIE